MKERDLDEFLALEKAFYTKLIETEGLTRELSEAVERQDQMSVRMVMSMRRKPVMELQEIRGQRKLKRLELSEGDGKQFDRLAEGGVPQCPGEESMVRQARMNRRLLERILEEDQEIHRKLCGNRPCYNEQ